MVLTSLSDSQRSNQRQYCCVFQLQIETVWGSSQKVDLYISNVVNTFQSFRVDFVLVFTATFSNRAFRSIQLNSWLTDLKPTSQTFPTNPSSLWEWTHLRVGWWKAFERSTTSTTSTWKRWVCDHGWDDVCDVRVTFSSSDRQQHPRAVRTRTSTPRRPLLRQHFRSAAARSRVHARNAATSAARRHHRYGEPGACCDVTCFAAKNNTTFWLCDVTVSCWMVLQGYFQLKANPGAWDLKLRQGRSQEIYEIAR